MFKVQELYDTFQFSLSDLEAVTYTDALLIFLSENVGFCSYKAYACHYLMSYELNTWSYGPITDDNDVQTLINGW